MKKITPKIIFGMAGLLAGLVLAGSAFTAYAAEPALTPANAVMSQADAASLKTALDALQTVLEQLNSDLQDGRITGTNVEAVNAALDSTKENLLVLGNTLTVLYPSLENLAESKVAPAPQSGTEAELNIEPSQQVSAEAAPLENGSEQTSPSSIWQSKTTIGIVLAVILVAVVVFISRRKPKTETQTQTV